MDNRDFTMRLLGQLARGPAGGQPQGPGPDPGGESRSAVLIAADLPAEEAVPVVLVAGALRRFGFRLTVRAGAVAAERIGGLLPPGGLLDAAVPLPRGIWERTSAVLAVPSRDLLVRMSLGLQDKPAAEAVLESLWRGLPVYMDFSCACPARPSGASAALAELYDGCARRLRDMGARQVLPGEYIAALRREPGAGRTAGAEAGGERSLRRMVVTRSDVLARDAGGGVWHLPADAIITSLARDAAKKAGLVLARDL